MTQRATPLLTCALACALACGSVAGCAPSATSRPPASAPADGYGAAAQRLAAGGSAGHIDPGASTKLVAGIGEMSSAEKRTKLNAAFNPEWPVPAGVVRSATVRGSALDFVIAMSAPASDVAGWYRSVMANRAFVERAERTQTDGTAEIEFARAGLFYFIRVKPVDSQASLLTAAVSGGTMPALPK